MNIKIRTIVNGIPESIAPLFDQRLFTALAPAFPPMRIKRFEGSEVGNVVCVEIFFILKWLTWESVITDAFLQTEKYQFIDEGRILPFFLKSWKHIHIVEKISENQSVVIDDINYTTPKWLPEILLYPILWFQFYQRKSVYRKFFAEHITH